MRILIIGASGRVGRLLSQVLMAQGHEVIGTVHAAHAEQNGMQTVSLDLATASVAEMVATIKALGPIDVVYFVSGSRGKQLLKVDLNGAVKVMQSLEIVGTKRYIQLSSAFADRQEKWSEGYLSDLTDYNIAKFFADKWLQENTYLDYTILQPGILVDAETVESVQFNPEHAGKNNIGTVAHVLAALAMHKQTIGQTIVMSSGAMTIEAAINNLR
ncbi:NAD(P)H-binding protein [Weissella diestrammenae]|uniref:NAD(P)H-binding protein n=2 Tax=Weissella diestrammenae TaxID=1162633 RepID=A0A7G9T7L1_9LACO|nr:NAD(P)H-binding protein [Weissella diestrammenae]QNN76086.1 NAD(P)H-binding protein [Weissella diestrammenae]